MSTESRNDSKRFTFSISTGASRRSFYPIFNKRFDHLEALLTIHRPKKALSAGVLGWLCPVSYLNASEGPSYCHKSIMLQFQICCYSQFSFS